MVAGPSLGGLLYTYTGFSLPFCSLGLSMVISGLLVAVFCSCKKQNSENTCSECSWKDILVCSGIPDYILALLTIGNVNNWFSASLEQHLYTAFGLVPAESGGIMMIFALLYSLTSPVVGVLLDYGFSTSKLLILGGVSSSLACFLLGPIPGFELLLETVPVCVVSLVLIGAGVASASLCGYLGMLDCARRIGSSEDILNKITCIWLMTLYLGGFLSVIFGGISADVYGFSCSSTIQGCITVIVTIWISCRAFYRQMFNTSSAEKDDQLETGEPFL
ncbi:MFS-type transporter SLC18B1 [Eurytemora carolleeae]|uniref:MFS-type transporter SLC18B1 n=1 Tax=Eurytemora carolleeae TaxID=1294199 RepID=UPI000C75B2ED|nr:MFS-type transporter SLC18B1 [Eurytemora carolleeae]|eukprot:XP_023323489.1 MFS-type transporter SLC18B1-like [Eurytemora affinis]